jgi:hypothetical protein
MWRSILERTVEDILDSGGDLETPVKVVSVAKELGVSEDEITAFLLNIGLTEDEIADVMVAA